MTASRANVPINLGPMRVVHVVRQFAPAVGGLENAVLSVCVALRRRGVDATVVTLDRLVTDPAKRLAATEVVSGVPVRRIPFKGSWRYPFAPSVLSHIKAADVVHVHGIDFFFDYLALTRPLHGRPLIASTHGGFFHTRFAKHLKRLHFLTVTRLSARAYAAICASSQNDKTLFAPIAPHNVALVENGADIAKWRDGAAPTPCRTLIFIGRFSSNKQLDKLLAIMVSLRTLDPTWKLILAGQSWDVTAIALAQEAERMGLGDAVEMLENPTNGVIGAAIARSSYVVSASSFEGFGLSVVEGMAAGLVPVLNRIAPFTALLAQAGCGRLVDVDDARTAASTIEDLHVRESGGVPSRRAALNAASRYSWETAADKFLAHYGHAQATFGPLMSRPQGSPP